MEKTITELEKGEDIVRVSLTEFRGRQYIDVRLFYMDGEGNWKPTKKGITLSPEMMRTVREAVDQALESLEDSSD